VRYVHDLYLKYKLLKLILNYYNDLVFQPSELFLHKDFGQVATVLGALHGQRVVHLICCNESNKDLSTFSGANVVQATKRFHLLPAKLDFLKNLAAYQFLLQHRGQFSCLVMFPFCPPSDLLIAKLFLALNPSAKIIVKLDANLAYLEQLQASYKASPLNCFRQHHYYRGILDIADVVIYETRKAGQLLGTGNFLGMCQPSKFLNIFNGISRDQVAIALDTQSNELATTRSNIIVFSGRLGSPEKNVELIFKSDPVPEGWKLKFVGSLDKAFMAVIAHYRACDPKFDTKYEFTGEIRDKNSYFQELSAAKILLLCSNKEGFPMVYAEAHYFGLYIVTTDVSGSEEATDGGRIGTIIPRNDPIALREALHSVCSNANLDKLSEAGRAYGSRHFIWEQSLRNPIIDSLFAPRISGLVR
jgi:glycosyltransferase involved in cell wall biosynthesis